MKSNHLTEHHLYPKSRFPMYAHKEWNIKKVTRQEHEAWHFLFSLMTPQEAFDWLLSGSFQLSAFDDRTMYAWNTLFDHMSNVEAAGIVLDEWMPDQGPEDL